MRWALDYLKGRCPVALSRTPEAGREGGTRPAMLTTPPLLKPTGAVGLLDPGRPLELPSGPTWRGMGSLPSTLFRAVSVAGGGPIPGTLMPAACKVRSRRSYLHANAHVRQCVRQAHLPFHVSHIGTCAHRWVVSVHDPGPTWPGLQVSRTWCSCPSRPAAPSPCDLSPCAHPRS